MSLRVYRLVHYVDDEVITCEMCFDRVCVVQELQLQRSTPDCEDHRRPESRSVQEIAADSLVGKATSEILMLVPPLHTICNVPLQCDMYMVHLFHCL